jgi:hypothetical protein
LILGGTLRGTQKLSVLRSCRFVVDSLHCFPFLACQLRR